MQATGLALITGGRSRREHDRGGRRRQRHADSVQAVNALKRLALTAADVVLVGHEIRTGATHEALRIGRSAGATTILNPAPAGGLEAPTLALADVLTPNEGELATLAGLRAGARTRGWATTTRPASGQSEARFVRGQMAARPPMGPLSKGGGGKKKKKKKGKGTGPLRRREA